MALSDLGDPAVDRLEVPDRPDVCHGLHQPECRPRLAVSGVLEHAAVRPYGGESELEAVVVVPDTEPRMERLLATLKN